MIRENLESIPGFPLPEPYRLRWYRPGDQVNWVQIHEQADLYNVVTSETFAEQFGGDEQALGNRQLYLCDGDGRAIGTATAWYDDNVEGQQYGRIHWVAIVPERQGKGLAKPLMTAALRRLRELGHDRVILTTHPPRLPAIHLYLTFGFVPVMETDRERGIWEEIQRRLAARR